MDVELNEYNVHPLNIGRTNQKRNCTMGEEGQQIKALGKEKDLGERSNNLGPDKLIARQAQRAQLKLTQFLYKGKHYSSSAQPMSKH